jgi:isocitrate lyase
MVTMTRKSAPTERVSPRQRITAATLTLSAALTAWSCAPAARAGTQVPSYSCPRGLTLTSTSHVGQGRASYLSGWTCSNSDRSITATPLSS